MVAAVAIVVLVILQRLMELRIARRNTAVLMAEGAVEHGAGHYPIIVLLHTAWLVAMLWVALQGPPINYYWVVFFLVLQAGRVWVLKTLGKYWTTRIITVPDAPLITGGPFRFVRHPNYLVVTLEIIVLPLAFSEWRLAVVFGLANLAILAWRIRAEERANSGRQQA
ncbi:hypothetical protein EOI86_08425 [Hwanghaeella grinnelliae]|uniref:Isoprenylcysteine carboxyl methyltransferase n=1 Tax=Hwanghaeella grinnelliae TaxID=2500179 RepID=A0A3S2WCF5_9PROT|nr:isoprenylcysteine carboxylmethyltransferase family protein [Hwanghaeella grinnelliae]RVU39253.1 hypothetical protein EOI86_08425 [Hwanghaeella grinnelliae]